MTVKPLEQDIEMRQAYAEVMIALMKKHEKIVLIQADLMYAHGFEAIEAMFPERIVNVGVAEANMIGIASGMSAMGLIPVVHSFASFASRRCYDQTFVSSGLGKNPITIIGSDPGVYATYNGATHMCFEDVALMRVIPDTVVTEPTDRYILADVLEQAILADATYYIRLPRREKRTLYNEDIEAPIGSSLCLRSGRDVCFLGAGMLSLCACLEAADILLQKGISASVYDFYSIKPIDEATLRHVAKNHALLVTCENHQAVGGLGGAIVEFVSESCPVTVIRCGIQGTFGEVGDMGYLAERFSLTGKALAEKIMHAYKEV